LEKSALREGGTLSYIIDIDGTLMDSDRPLDGAVEFIRRLNEDGADYLLMTNSIRTPEKQAERLTRAGLAVERGRILNPIAAINEYLARRGIERARIVGSEEEMEQVRAAHDDKDNEITILLDFEKGNKGYDDLQDVLGDIEKGVEVITASASPYYVRSGAKRIDTGAFVGLLEGVGGVSIRNFGKPSDAYFEAAGSILRSGKSDVFVIGDDWSTDIKGANDWGAKSILVKTGKYKVGDEERETPTALIESLLGMLDKPSAKERP